MVPLLRIIVTSKRVVHFHTVTVALGTTVYVSPLRKTQYYLFSLYLALSAFFLSLKTSDQQKSVHCMGCFSFFCAVRAKHLFQTTTDIKVYAVGWPVLICTFLGVRFAYNFMNAIRLSLRFTVLLLSFLSIELTASVGRFVSFSTTFRMRHKLISWKRWKIQNDSFSWLIFLPLPTTFALFDFRCEE